MIIDEKLLDQLPARSKRSKKGDNGIVLVIGGNKLYHGAPLLASLAAYRTGVDLVYLAVPKSISIPIRAYSPSIIVLPLPDEKLTIGSVNRLLTMLPKHVDAATIGMGLSVRKEGLLRLIKELHNNNTKLVLDASALIPDILDIVRDDIITPHIGEFKRLFGTKLSDDEQVRIEMVKQYASKYDITILLKAYTDIISDGEKVGLNKTHNCAMTVGGSGDVLAGITSSLLAKGLDTFNAASMAALINGSAGNLAYNRLGLHIMPTDIIDSIPYVMKDHEMIID
jgi:NAD(P)H-hydrate epimerase